MHYCWKRKNTSMRHISSEEGGRGMHSEYERSQATDTSPALNTKAHTKSCVLRPSMNNTLFTRITPPPWQDEKKKKTRVTISIGKGRNAGMRGWARGSQNLDAKPGAAAKATSTRQEHISVNKCGNRHPKSE